MNRKLNPDEQKIYETNVKNLENRQAILQSMKRHRELMVKEYLYTEYLLQIEEHKRSIGAINQEFTQNEAKLNIYRSHLTDGVPPVKKEGEKKNGR